jgi:dipeptidyl aminopeptidase/acylaminoacyl peptidase
MNILARQTIGQRLDRRSTPPGARTSHAEEQAPNSTRVRAHGVHERATAHDESPKEHDTPRFSPDGRTLAFVESDGYSRRNIRVLDLAAGVTRRVHDCDGSCESLAWSPDGQPPLLRRSRATTSSSTTIARSTACDVAGRPARAAHERRPRARAGRGVGGATRRATSSTSRRTAGARRSSCATPTGQNARVLLAPRRVRPPRAAPAGHRTAGASSIRPGSTATGAATCSCSR